MTTYSVATTDDAIALADLFRADGTYQLFRGQRQNWPMRSSLQRRAGPEQEAALEWLRRFRAWLFRTNGLWTIAADSDQSMAVAQHYGIATDFVDLTPDPAIAAFFATHGSDAGIDETSVILCFNIDQLRQFWADRFEGFRAPELIEISVPNLWRLEAQRGCFLFCPYGEFEQFYPVDRILFRRAETTRVPSIEQIYPANKSPLEVLLDQFFQLKAIDEANAEFIPLIRHTINLESHPEGYDRDDFIDGTLDELPSWSRSDVRDWIAIPHQRYSLTVGDAVLEIPVSLVPDPIQVRAAVAEFVRAAVAGRPELRREAVRFIIAAPEYHAPNAIVDLEHLLPRLWDGLRALLARTMSWRSRVGGTAWRSDWERWRT